MENTKENSNKEVMNFQTFYKRLKPERRKFIKYEILKTCQISESTLGRCSRGLRKFSILEQVAILSIIEKEAGREFERESFFNLTENQ